MDWSTYEITYRMVADFSKSLNNALVLPFKRTDEIASKLHGAKLFSTLDIWSSYYIISIDENRRKYNASQLNMENINFSTSYLAST